MASKESWNVKFPKMSLNLLASTPNLKNIFASDIKSEVQKNTNSLSDHFLHFDPPHPIF